MGLVGRRAVLPLAFLVAALAWPTAAFAANGSLVNGVMIYDAAVDGSEGNNVSVTAGFSSEPTYVVTDAPAVTIHAASPCFQGATTNVMQCPQDGNGSGAITLLQVSLGDGNDNVLV